LEGFQHMCGWNVCNFEKFAIISLIADLDFIAHVSFRRRKQKSELIIGLVFKKVQFAEKPAKSLSDNPQAPKSQ